MRFPLPTPFRFVSFDRWNGNGQFCFFFFSWVKFFAFYEGRVTENHVWSRKTKQNETPLANEHETKWNDGTSVIYYNFHQSRNKYGEKEREREKKWEEKHEEETKWWAVTDRQVGRLPGQWRYLVFFIFFFDFLIFFTEFRYKFDPACAGPTVRN